MAGETPILDLETVIERPTIVIDGELYGILSPEELSVIDHQRFATQGRRMDKLYEMESLSDREGHELSKIVRDVSDRILVEVPDDIRDKLSDAHRVSICEVFTRLPLQAKIKALAAEALTIAAAAEEAKTEQSTGGMPSPASSDSTAANPPDGSTTPPSTLSGHSSE